jgi:hypothetical protein
MNINEFRKKSRVIDVLTESRRISSQPKFEYAQVQHSVVTYATN